MSVIEKGSSHVVGVGEWAVSDDPGEALVTYALGICVGVVVWDAQAFVGGLLHFQLPSSSLDPAKAKARPGMFGDTGLAGMWDELYGKGATRRHLRVWLLGGARVTQGDFFDIGERNLLLARRWLWKNGLSPVAESVGGDESRTIRLDVGEGRVWVRQGGREYEMLKGGHHGVERVDRR